jgi:23S rRNA pseudouridine1911/1915/1917 synthase
VKITIKKSNTLIGFLNEKYPDSPRTRIKKLLQSGIIRINGQPVTLHSFKLNPGDKVEINPSETKTTAAKLPFPVLFEDKHVIVVDKPAGIATSSNDGSTSVQEILSGTMNSISKGTVRTYVVHRLDKEVSGVLLFAKSYDAMITIKNNWKETEKHYYALVEGIPVKMEDTIKSWLIEDRSQKVHTTFERPEAKFAITSYKVLKSLHDHALLDVSTETGRKNQIRVHLSDIKCPIVGDRKYGASTEFKRRVRLHAFSLSFPHPVTGEKTLIESPMPKGFLSLKPRNEHYK